MSRVAEEERGSAEEGNGLEELVKAVEATERTPDLYESGDDHNNYKYHARVGVAAWEER